MALVKVSSSDGLDARLRRLCTLSWVPKLFLYSFAFARENLGRATCTGSEVSRDMTIPSQRSSEILMITMYPASGRSLTNAAYDGGCFEKVLKPGIARILASKPSHFLDSSKWARSSFCSAIFSESCWRSQFRVSLLPSPTAPIRPLHLAQPGYRVLGDRRWAYVGDWLDPKRDIDLARAIRKLCRCVRARVPQQQPRKEAPRQTVTVRIDLRRYSPNRLLARGG